jgi:hypothetical protein
MEVALRSSRTRTTVPSRISRTIGSSASEREAAISAGDSNPEPLVRLRTIRSVVGQQVNTYADLDLEILVWLGRTDEALQYARLRTRSSAVSGLVVIAKTLAATGVKTDAVLLNEAQQIATTIADEHERSTALMQLVTAFATTGNFETAALLARAIPLEWQRAHALYEFVGLLVQAGLLDKAAAVARAIELSTEHDMALRIVKRAREGEDPSPQLEARVRELDHEHSSSSPFQPHCSAITGRFQKKSIAGMRKLRKIRQFSTHWPKEFATTRKPRLSWERWCTWVPA